MNMQNLKKMLNNEMRLYTKKTQKIKETQIQKQTQILNLENIQRQPQTTIQRQTITQTQKQEQTQQERQIIREIQRITQDTNIKVPINIIPTPQLPPPIIPKADFGFGGITGYRKRKKVKHKPGLYYTPDFTAKALGINIKTNTKLAKQMLKDTFSGFEIRPGVIPA